MKEKNLTRKQRTGINVAVAILHQLTVAVVGLILPRFVLTAYGSEVNGVVQTITQIFSYTVLLECGIGGMVRASFYKPLATGDNEAVSDIFNNTRRFFGRISVAFAVLAVCLAFLSKIIIKTDFDAVYVGTLVVILGVNHYFNYYFGITQQILMNADQKLYVAQTVQIITTVLNAVVCIFAIKLGAGIHIVKLISAVVFLLNPIVYRLYVKRHYIIGRKIYDAGRELPKKREGVIHHIAFFVHRNTDIVLLSLFCGAKEVSVYSVYYSIVVMAESFLNAVANGVSGAIGNMIAKKEDGVLSQSFEIHESVNTLVSTFFYTVAAIVIVPFVTFYTGGVNDVNYIRPVFAWLIIGAQWFYCVRLPYGNVVSAACHYKETKIGAYAEVGLNVVISVSLVPWLGMTGIAIGTLVAMAVRTFYIVWYLSRNILYRRVWRFIKTVGSNLVAAVVTVVVFVKFYNVSYSGFVSWAFDAAIISVIVFAVLTVINLAVNCSLYKTVFFRRKKQ